MTLTVHPRPDANNTRNPFAPTTVIDTVPRTPKDPATSRQRRARVYTIQNHAAWFQIALFLEGAPSKKGRRA
jgi:hypothetical protein